MKAQSGIEGDQIDTMDEGFLLNRLSKIHLQQFLACIRHGMVCKSDNNLLAQVSSLFP